jgi:hypothetical protein
MIYEDFRLSIASGAIDLDAGFTSLHYTESLSQVRCAESRVSFNAAHAALCLLR